MKKIVLAVVLALLPSLALAQTSFNFYQGFVPTAAQWNSYFAYKADVGALKPVATTGSAADLSTGILPTARLSTCSLSFCTVHITGINFNAGNADTAIPIVLPTGYTRFLAHRLYIWGASHTLVTATFGLFPQTAAAGSPMISAGATITVSATTDGAANNAEVFSMALAAPTFVAASLTVPNTIYLRVGTAEGATATGNVTLIYIPLP